MGRYTEWEARASELEEVRGCNEWRMIDEHPDYNAHRVRYRYEKLSRLRASGDIIGMISVLNEGIHGNQDGIGNPRLYSHSELGTKHLIEDYVEVVCICLLNIADAGPADIGFDEKLSFFRRANHCFGRSALALSGAAGLIYFHQGVVDSLIDQNLLPEVISGSSAGSWMCAQLGTYSDKELKSHFVRHRYTSPDYGAHRLSGSDLLGFLVSSRKVRSSYKDAMVDEFVEPDLTFEEAFEKTGRYINISVAAAEHNQTARLLNVITTPRVTISSACKASSSIPGLFDPVQLYAKSESGRNVKYIPGQLWVDGSVTDDLPFRKLARLYGANHFIVSMANPVAIPFIATDPVQPGFTVSSSARSVVTHIGKEVLKCAHSSLGRLGGRPISEPISLLQQLVNQQYHGDINISLDTKQIDLRRFFFSYKSESDIEELIAEGQRACWAKLAQIRTSSAISRTLHGILKNIEIESISEKHEHRRSHMIL
ncbi:MAG: DUF3336 domain-containing protein [Pseudomonadota bacterium]